MIIVAGTLQASAEAHDAVVDAVEALTAPTRAEAGCLEFTFWADLRRLGCFHVFEVWASDADFSAHLATPHLAAFREARARFGAQMALRRYQAEELLRA